MQLKVAISRYQSSGTRGGGRDWRKECRMKTVENWSFGGKCEKVKASIPVEQACAIV
jgi:hypothetical protein